MQPPHPNRQHVELELAYAFGGNVLNQEDAILAWIEAILFTENHSMTETAIRDQLCLGNTIYPPIQVEAVEVQAALQRGARKDALAGVNGLWGLTEREQLALKDAESEAISVENVVKKEWLDQLTQAHVQTLGIDFHDIGQEVWGFLEAFLTKALRHYTHQLKDTGDMTASSLPERLEHAISEVVPRSHALYPILKAELPGFLASAEGLRKKYIGRIFSTALYAFRTSVTNLSSQQLTQVVRGQAMYLDTNVLFALVGIEGEENIETSVRRLVGIATQIGFLLYFTQSTKDEYVRTLRAYCNNLYLPDSTEPSTDTRTRAMPGVVRAYLRLYSKESLTPEEFYTRFKDLERLAGNYDVHLDSHPDRIIFDQVRGTQLHDDLKRELTEVSTTKSLTAIEHDVDLFSYVLFTRNKKTVIADAKCWIITQDRTLPQLNHRYSPEMPVALTLDTWLAMFRKLLPRVDNFDEFFAGLVTRRIMPSFYLEPKVLSGFQQLMASKGRKAQEVLDKIISTVDAREFNAIASQPGDTQLASLELLIQKQEQIMERARRYAATGPKSQLERERVERQEEKNRLDLELQRSRDDQQQSVQELRHELETRLAEQDNRHALERLGAQVPLAQKNVLLWTAGALFLFTCSLVVTGFAVKVGYDFISQKVVSGLVPTLQALSEFRDWGAVFALSVWGFFASAWRKREQSERKLHDLERAIASHQKSDGQVAPN
jgi:hypothetical protein